MFIKNLPPRAKKGRAEEEFSNNCPALNWRNRGRPTCGEASINSLGETASELQIRTFQRNNKYRQIFSLSKRKFIFTITFTLHKQVLKCPSLRSFARPLLFFAEGSFKWKNNRQSGQITRLFARNCQRKLLDLVTWCVLTLLKCPTTMHQKPPSLR